LKKRTLFYCSLADITAKNSHSPLSKDFAAMFANWKAKDRPNICSAIGPKEFTAKIRILVMIHLHSAI